MIKLEPNTKENNTTLEAFQALSFEQQVKHIRKYIPIKKKLPGMPGVWQYVKLESTECGIRMKCTKTGYIKEIEAYPADQLAELYEQTFYMVKALHAKRNQN